MDKIVRVYDIILDKNHDACKPNCTADDIGTIYYAEIDELSPTADGDFQLSTARPYHYNISHFPLKNELVHLKLTVSPEHNEQGKPINYYLAPLSIMQNTNSNSFINKLTAKKDNYFIPNPFIKRLQPYEGDIFMQGRFGNSIRFGSTIDKTQVIRKNSWSNEGTIGSPITIISNGHEKVPISVEEEYEHTVENINGDKASIWLCSNQQISNIEIASLHDLSYYYDTERSKQEEQPNTPNNDLEENVQEDVPLNTADNLPPEELQQTEELSDFTSEEVDYYDIAPTEQQSIRNIDNTVLGENYVIPDTINNQYLNESMGSISGAKFKRAHNIISALATSNGIDNYPGADEYLNPNLTADFIWGNLEKLHEKCIIPLLDAFGAENIKITSAYRSIDLNKLMGGTENSQHISGYAVDLVSTKHSSSELWNYCNQFLEFNQLIWEFPERGDFTHIDYDFSWIHISYIEGNNIKTRTMSSDVEIYHEMIDEGQTEPVNRRGKYSHDIIEADESIVGFTDF